MWQKLAIFYGKICQFLFQNLAKFRISNGNFLRCQVKLVSCLKRSHHLVCLLCLRCKTFKTKNVKRFYNLLKKIPPQTQLVIAWIPSHVGISGNEKADRLAKAALTSSLAAHSQVCWSNLKPRVDTYICTAWQALWNNETRNKLYEIRSNLKESLCNTTQPLYRKQETVMTRLRIGHTWITHSYLLKKEDQPFCHACDNPFYCKAYPSRMLRFYSY